MAKKSEGGGSAIYGIGFIGALIYWMQAATGFTTVITGFFKALFWPAYLVFQALTQVYGAS